MNELMVKDSRTSVLYKSRTPVLCAAITSVIQSHQMKYGERLKMARKKAGFSQEELADKAGVGTQENISKLERTDATGSEYTVQYARACGVSPDWLASEQGDMIEGLVIRDPRIKSAALLMQQLPDYALDQAVKNVAAIGELVGKAKASNGDI